MMEMGIFASMTQSIDEAVASKIAEKHGFLLDIKHRGDATTQQAQDVHAFIRRVLAAMFDEATARRVRIQYGGSVKPSNARELMSQPDVDGALVGGASLTVRDFADIVKNSI